MIKASNKLKERRYLGGKLTKLRGLPLTQQPRDIPPKVIKKSLPTISRYKEISRLPVTEGRREIDDETRPFILGHKLIVAELFGFL